MRLSIRKPGYHQLGDAGGANRFLPRGGEANTVSKSIIANARRAEVAPMSVSAPDMEKIAIARIASIFSITTEKIDMGWRFGHELRSSFSSDFRRNELDIVNDDIHDATDRETLRAFSSGALTISTVADYCDLMVRRSKVDLKKVLDVLNVS